MNKKKGELIATMIDLPHFSFRTRGSPTLRKFSTTKTFLRFPHSIFLF